VAPQARKVPLCDSTHLQEARPAEYRFRVRPGYPAELLCRECVLGRTGIHEALTPEWAGPFVEPLR